MKARLATVAFKQRKVGSFNEFVESVKRHIYFAADYNAKLIMFPEYFTASLLALNADWQTWTAPLLEYLQTIAQECKLYIQAGTHITRDESVNNFVNRAFFIGPNGAVKYQDKLHLTPFEIHPLQLARGKQLEIFATAIGKIAILICYDIEFPYLAQKAAQAGADILLVPSYTDDPAGFYRVSLCARARCIENQLYVVQAPLISGLNNVRNFEQAFGKACIYTPCDLQFPADGILAASEFNDEACIIGELDLGLLHEVRENGSVTPLKEAKSADNFPILVSHF
jgi:predicted amidohydrolase